MAKGPWNQAAKARNAFADMFEELSEDQVDGESLAGHWTPKHVLGHVVFFAEFKMPSFMLNMAKAGFNYDKMADRVAQKIAVAPTEELLSRLRAGATTPAPVPGFTEMIPVGDVAVHIQDIRRPNGLSGSLDEDILSTALDFVTTHKIGIDLAEIPNRDSVRFEASDLDWSFGDGPVASGTGEQILMTSGRPGQR